MTWNCSFSQNYANYTISDGLPSNHVYTIRQDVDGFIWFLTDKGMVKYNGTEFKQFTTREGLPNNDVWEAFVTSDHKIWYLSKAAQLGYISKDTVRAFPNEIPNEIINPIFSYQIDKDVYLSGSTKTHQLIDGVWKRIDDSKGQLKVFHPKVKSLNLHKSTNTLFVYDKDDKVIARFEAKDFILNAKRGHITDSLYYFVNTKGYFILDLNTLKLYRKLFKDQLDIETVNYARINLFNNTLQISGAGFVAYLNDQFDVETPFFFPKDIQAHFGLIDASKSIWCATFNNGVYKIPDHKKAVTYTFQGEKVQTLDVLNNQLYASVYDNGFYKYDPKKYFFDLKLQLKGYKYGTQYIEAVDAMYYLSQGNAYSEIKRTPLLRYNHVTANSDNKDKVRKLIYHQQQLYGLFAFGLSQLDSNTFNVDKEFSHAGTSDLMSFNEVLYVATTNGLKVFENDTFTPKNYDNTLLNISVLNLKPLSDTQFLINTDGFGTYIASDSALEFLKGTEYLSVQDAFVEANAIWLATNKGVLVYEKKTSGDYFLKTTVNTENGLPMNNVNSVAVLNDTLFVATDNGLTLLSEPVVETSLFLDIYIDKVLWNAKTLSNDVSVNYTSNNTLNIKVASIDFSEDQQTDVFDYKLHPIQNEWVTASSEVINYNDLQPDDYQFIASKNGVETSFYFTIRPLWWQTLGFRISAGVILGVLLMSGVWLLSKRMQQRKDERLIREKELSEIQLKALRSQMNPHFVFNSLAAIQFYINDNNFEASERYLVKFSKLIRQFFELSKENEISLKGEITLLRSYLEIEKLRFKEKLEFDIVIDEKLNIETTKIPTMLLQPIVENAVNHGVFNKLGNGRVIVSFSYEDAQTFVVSITDDGVGFTNTQPSHKGHHSSNVIADRLKFLNQTGNWLITFENDVLNSEAKDKGNKAIFRIRQLNQV